MMTTIINPMVEALVPRKSVLFLDVMVGGSWRGCVRVPVTPGRSYGMEELRAFVRMMRPSLGGVDFDILPTDKFVKH